VNRVVVIGDALVDEMRDQFGSTDAPGGSALNVAVGLAVLGVPATLIAMIGDDPDGTMLRDYASGRGVQVLASGSPLGTGRAVSDRSQGEPRYSFSDAARARSIHFSDEMMAALEDAPLVVISGFPFDAPAEVAELRRALGGHPRVLLDANPREGFIRDRAAFVAAFEEIAGLCELVKIGDEDAQLLYAAGVGDVVLPSPVVLATEGSRGATVTWPLGSVHRDIVVDDRPVIDTMGAGDATFASVIAGLASGSTQWDAMLDNAMHIAAETIRHAGGELRQPR
jgi:fructokinase